jgi:hypothetical protein
VQRILIVLGVLLIVVGLFWPLLMKLRLGRLPGDIFIQSEHVNFYFPLTTSILVSLLLTLILWLLNR